MSNLAADIKRTILAAVPDAEVYVNDPDGEHLEAVVVSQSFEGLMLVKQHQVVMKALKEKFETTMHALALKTFSPSKWAPVKDDFLNRLS
jgi:acid stress-induced BolA-like protein IbaG/YrbA